MRFLNHLCYENTQQEGSGIFFWLTSPVKEEQRAETREKLPEDIRPLFDKMQLDCPDHINQLPVAIHGKKGILVSYVLNDADVSKLCAVEFVGKDENRAVFDWLNDVAAKAERTMLIKAYHAEIVVGYRALDSNSSFSMFVPEEFCTCRGMMEELSGRLVSFMEGERDNSHCVNTISGRTILFRMEDDIL